MQMDFQASKIRNRKKQTILIAKLKFLLLCVCVCALLWGVFVCV